MNRQQVEIEKIVAGGFGLARDKNGVLFIEKALVGEIVEYEFYSKRFAKITKIIKASKHRKEDFNLPTANFSFIDYPIQLQYKQEIVKDTLKRIAKIDLKPNVVQSNRELYYRNKAQYLIINENLAYRENLSYNPIFLKKDFLASCVINDFINKLDLKQIKEVFEVTFRSSFLTKEIITVITSKTLNIDTAKYLNDLGANVVYSELNKKRFIKNKIIFGKNIIKERFGYLDLSISGTDFAQINPEMAGKLYKKIFELVKNKNVIDLYGGSGAIGLNLAKNNKITVVDVSKTAIEQGKKDAKSLELDVDFIHLKAEKFDIPKKIDVIIVDPPRKGLDNITKYKIIESKVKEIVYVSCDIATFARDLKFFLDSNYKIEHFEVYDFYPQTSHTETLCLLSKN